MATVKITGSIADVVGTAAIGARLTIQSVLPGWSNGAALILGEPFVVTADGSGDVDFDVEPGDYRVLFQLSSGEKSVGMSVGSDGPYDLAEVINATTAQALTTILQTVLGYKQDAEAAAGQTAADALATADDRAQTTLDRAAAAASAAAASLAEQQSQSAAVLAGAPIAPTFPTDDTETAALPSPFLLIAPEGVQSWTHSGTFASLAQGPYASRIEFDDAAALLAYNGPALPVGLVVRTRAEGYSYEVVASGGNEVTAGEDLLKVSPGHDGFYSAMAFGSFSAGLNAKVSTGSQSVHAAHIPVGVHTLDSPISLTGYVNISGAGEGSVVLVPAGTVGFTYASQAGVADDHPHNYLRDFRIQGDAVVSAYPVGGTGGTTTGLKWPAIDNEGNFGSTYGMSFWGHAVGREITKSYTHMGVYDYYRGCDVGLLLNRDTSYMLLGSYFRLNSDAAIRIIGGQNFMMVGGAIEGNPGIGIDYEDPVDASGNGQIVLDGVYFEVNGNQAAGIPSIRIPDGARTMVSVRGGSYWLNVQSGVTSGPYLMGDNLDMEGATINAPIYAKHARVRQVRGSAGRGTWNTMPTEALSRLYGLRAPTKFHEFEPAYDDHPDFTASTGGMTIGTRLFGRNPRVIPGATNLVSGTYPYGASASSGATGAANASLNYGDGDFYKVTFGGSVGSFSSNYATLFTAPDSAKPFRTFATLIYPEDDFEFGAVMSIGGQAITCFYKLDAGEHYRVIFSAQRPMSAGNAILRIFPLDASGPVVNFLPLWGNQVASYAQQLEYISMLVKGDL